MYSYFSRHAGLAQLVARHLAKVEVAGSNPVARSMNCRRSTNRSAAFLLRARPLRFLPRGGDRRNNRNAGGTWAQAADSRGSSVFRLAKGQGPKIFSNEFEIWACARPTVPVYYPLRLRA